MLLFKALCVYITSCINELTAMIKGDFTALSLTTDNGGYPRWAFGFGLWSFCARHADQWSCCWWFRRELEEDEKAVPGDHWTRNQTQAFQAGHNYRTPTLGYINCELSPLNWITHINSTEHVLTCGGCILINFQLSSISWAEISI